jgi:hypothetical protein
MTNAGEGRNKKEIDLPSFNPLDPRRNRKKNSFIPTGWRLELPISSISLLLPPRQQEENSRRREIRSRFGTKVALLKGIRSDPPPNSNLHDGNRQGEEPTNHQSPTTSSGERIPNGMKPSNPKPTTIHIQTSLPPTAGHLGRRRWG